MSEQDGGEAAAAAAVIFLRETECDTHTTWVDPIESVRSCSTTVFGKASFFIYCYDATSANIAAKEPEFQPQLLAHCDLVTFPFLYPNSPSFFLPFDVTAISHPSLQPSRRPSPFSSASPSGQPTISATVEIRTSVRAQIRGVFQPFCVMLTSTNDTLYCIRLFDNSNEHASNTVFLPNLP